MGRVVCTGGEVGAARGDHGVKWSSDVDACYAMRSACSPSCGVVMPSEGKFLRRIWPVTWSVGGGWGER